MATCKACARRLEDDGRGVAPRVAIFGAGIAGMTAAHELAERGFGVDVFERGVRVGGLAASQPFYSDRIFGARPHRPPGGGAGAGGVTNGTDSGDPGPLLPGEHGFRSFYSFYRHVTDTMKRIPIVDRGSAGAATAVGKPECVADNLLPTYKVAIARSDNTFREIQYDRRKARSSASALYTLGVWMLAMGFQSKDLARVATRLLQFLTSCTRRRYEQLTNLSLMDFLARDGVGVSKQFQTEFKNTSRFLVAIDPQDGDAMTQAMIMARLLLDPVVQGEGGNANVDRVLNGPTSERWLEPWHRFLAGDDGASFPERGAEGEGVRFFFEQELHRFVFDGKRRRGKGEIVGAVLSCRARGCTLRTPYQLDGGDQGPGAGRSGSYGYFVAAIPGDVLWETITDRPAASGAARPPGRRGAQGAGARENRAMMDADARETARHAQAVSTGERSWINTVGDPPLERLSELVKKSSRANYHPWMSGIQFFLSDNITVLPGHIHFANSPWALTAVCQSQFWGADFFVRYGHRRVRSIISVDICEFEVPGSGGKTAKECTGDEIAAEVWHQMASGLRAWNMLLPQPFARASGATRKTAARYERQPPPWQIKTTSTGGGRRSRSSAGKARGAVSATVAGRRSPIPIPYLDHHIDDRIVFAGNNPSTGKIDATATAKAVSYFVPGVRSWASRPGPLPSSINWDRGYRVRLGRLVVIGNFAQTFTSINTMEAANESARHGINGLLADMERQAEMRAERAGGSKEDSRVRYERCTIWPLEADEPPDLAFLKEVDERLYEKDPTGKHLFEMLKVDQWMSLLFPQAPDIDNFPFDDEDEQAVGSRRRGEKFADADKWRMFERRFGDVWERILAMGRFSSFFT